MDAVAVKQALRPYKLYIEGKWTEVGRHGQHSGDESCHGGTTHDRP